MPRYLKGLILILVLVVFLPSFARADSCSEPKVAVIQEIINVNENKFFDHLNTQYPEQPRASWLYQIQEKVLEELRMNSPETEFISVEGDTPPDCTYIFKCIFNLIAAGEDIVVAGVPQSKYIAYHMTSNLSSMDACGIHPKILYVEITRDDEDLNHTIERNVAGFGDIGSRIQEFEDKQPVPPRGPEMTVSPSRKYVSPLKEERKLDLGIKVTNCRGEDVYDKNHGQKVFLPMKTERGEIEPTEDFPQRYWPFTTQLMLEIVRPAGASATYIPSRKDFPPARKALIS
jgi:hypothetical protein